MEVGEDVGREVEVGSEGLFVEEGPEGLLVVVLEDVGEAGVVGGALPPHSFTAQA